MPESQASRRTLFGIAVALSIFASAARAEIPLLLYAPWPDYGTQRPAWVEVTAALGADARLNPALFSPELLGPAQAVLDREPDPQTGCIAYGEVYEDEIDPPDRSSPEKLVRTSATIIVGKVVSRAFGFQFAVPGQMLEMEVLSAIPRLAARERVLVFVPVGRFEVAQKILCKSDRNYVTPPDVGGVVALFLPDVYDGPDPYVNLRFASSLTVVAGDSLLVSREVQAAEDAVAKDRASD